jgi:hypothetical protein
MKNRYTSKLSAGVFGLVGILHLWRAIAGLELNIGTFSLPVWTSYVAFVLAWGLAYLNIVEDKK